MGVEMGGPREVPGTPRHGRRRRALQVPGTSSCETRPLLAPGTGSPAVRPHGPRCGRTRGQPYHPPATSCLPANPEIVQRDATGWPACMGRVLAAGGAFVTQCPGRIPRPRCFTGAVSLALKHCSSCSMLAVSTAIITRNDRTEDPGWLGTTVGEGRRDAAHCVLRRSYGAPQPVPPSGPRKRTPTRDSTPSSSTDHVISHSGRDFPQP